MNNRTGKERLVVDQSYSRADASLWDDSDLVRLWNEQLNVINGKEEAHRLSLPQEPSHLQETGSDGGDSAEHSSIMSSSLSEPVEASVLSDKNTSDDGPDSENNSHPTRRRPRKEPHGTLPLPNALPIADLPREVQQLVVSFYTAGYAAGKYAAKIEERQGRGKRGRH